MNFLAVEGVDFPVIVRLRENGHDVKSILEEFPASADDLVLGLANEENRILITLDKDFGELVFRLQKIHAGIILLRLEELTSEVKAEILIKIIEQHGEELLNAFTVVRENFVRIRK
ncbi:MAG: DUF5615 family PIN-like protein [Bacteroidetes bacterium]|nr:DUF5615 family PIN-like protein [Bacteroidota bacterium]MBI3482234.1 DUF5615 family PIN-like protein [Bacteroidota bacterium]